MITNKPKKKIVLVRPHVFSKTRPYSGAPLALLAISRFLVKDGYTVKIIDPLVNKDYIAATVKEAKDAVCVGFSVLTGYSIYDGLQIARAVRKKYPKVPLVWGGWHPSILPHETIKDELVDIVVYGQGERTFTELVKALKSKKSLKNILGVIYKDKRGKIIENAPRPIESLDNFPPVPYHLIDVEKFLAPQEYGQRSLVYYTSYGCPHRCLFCVEQIVNKRRWVGLSPEKAAEEIAELKQKYNIDSIQIIDSNFFISEERSRRFAKKLIELNVNIKWGNVNGRTRQMSQYSDDTWKLMKDSGLACILIGSESGNNNTLAYMQKDITVSDTIKLTKICAKYDVKILSSFLVGFPRSKNLNRCHKITDKELTSSLRLIDRMFKIYPRIRQMFALYLPYPSTALFEQSRQMGLEIPDKFEDWHEYLIAAEDASKMKVRQTWVTRKQAKKILMISIYIFFFKDPDSFGLVTARIKNIFYKGFLYLGFRSFKALVDLRWKFKYFGLPLDFAFYNVLRKYSGLG